MTKKVHNIRQKSKERWLRLLKKAIEENENITLNHHYRFKGKALGTFLVDVKKRDRKDLIEKIEKMGFNIRRHRKDPELTAERFIFKLWNAKKDNKQHFQTHFNMLILPKRFVLKKSTIKEIDFLWEKKFDEKRSWEPKKSTKNRIETWKEFRYDETKNPEKKWFRPKTVMGYIYTFVFYYKQRPDRLAKLITHFTDQEIKELKKEGFFKAKKA